MIPAGPFLGLWLMADGMAYGLWLERDALLRDRYGFAGAGATGFAGAGTAAGAGGCIVDRTTRKPIVLSRVTGSAEPR